MRFFPEISYPGACLTIHYKPFSFCNVIPCLPWPFSADRYNRALQPNSCPYHKMPVPCIPRKPFCIRTRRTCLPVNRGRVISERPENYSRYLQIFVFLRGLPRPVSNRRGRLLLCVIRNTRRCLPDILSSWLPCRVS